MHADGATAARERRGVPRTDFRRPVHCLLGLPFDAIGRHEAAARVVAAAASGSSCFLSTPNVNFLVASRHDTAFRDSVIRSDLSVADGMPIVWIARLLGVPLPERVAGSDIFESLVQDAPRPLKVFFFGGPDGAAEMACARLNAMRGPVRCVGHAFPGFGTVEQMSGPGLLDRINRSGADLVVVALGARKGQAWIERNRAAIAAPVVSHLGAVVNFVAGTTRRAPALLRRLGLEWLWRIREEPALWRRYVGDALGLSRLMAFHVVPCLARRALLRRGNPRAPASVSSERGVGAIRLSLSGPCDKALLPALRAAIEAATGEPGDIELDLAELTSIDEASLGTLLLLYGHQSRVSRRLRVVRASSEARRELHLHCAEFLLEGSDAGMGSGAAGQIR